MVLLGGGFGSELGDLVVMLTFGSFLTEEVEWFQFFLLFLGIWENFRDLFASIEDILAVGKVVLRFGEWLTVEDGDLGDGVLLPKFEHFIIRLHIAFHQSFFTLINTTTANALCFVEIRHFHVFFRTEGYLLQWS